MTPENSTARDPFTDPKVGDLFRTETREDGFNITVTEVHEDGFLFPGDPAGWVVATIATDEGVTSGEEHPKELPLPNTWQYQGNTEGQTT